MKSQLKLRSKSNRESCRWQISTIWQNKGKEISTGVLSLIFGSANPQDVALAFLSTDKLDAEVEKKSARKELLGLLRNAYDIEFPASVTLSEAREKLGPSCSSHRLCRGVRGFSTVISRFGKDSFFPERQRPECHTARNWRLRRDVRDSYVAAANKVEQEFSLASLKLDQGRLRELETFLAGERNLLQHVERNFHWSLQ